MKMKEIGPVVVVVVASLAPPGSANGLCGGVVDLPIVPYDNRL